MERAWQFKRGVAGAPDLFVEAGDAPWAKWGTDEERENGLHEYVNAYNYCFSVDEENQIWHYSFGASTVWTIRCVGFLDHFIFHTKYFAPYAALTEEDAGDLFADLKKTIKTEE